MVSLMAVVAAIASSRAPLAVAMGVQCHTRVASAAVTEAWHRTETMKFF